MKRSCLFLWVLLLCGSGCICNSLGSTPPASICDGLIAENGETTPPFPYPYGPYGYSVPGGPMADGWYTSARLHAGLILPSADTLGVAASIDATLEMNLGFYSLNVGAGFYQMADGDLGGLVRVFPIRVGGKVWSDDPRYCIPRFYVGMSLGPYICDHTRPEVVFDSTVGFDFLAGAEIYPQENLSLGLELGYTINQPNVTITGIPYGAHLDVFFLKASFGYVY